VVRDDKPLPDLCWQVCSGMVMAPEDCWATGRIRISARPNILGFMQAVNGSDRSVVYKRRLDVRA
jgi:hypothetical protein